VTERKKKVQTRAATGQASRQLTIELVANILDFLLNMSQSGLELRGGVGPKVTRVMALGVG
jgi:hypothetical protein